MKKISAISLSIIISIAAYGQNLLIANNNPGAATGVNVFTGATALEDALAAASTTAPYDIIYVVPSSLTYNNITIDRGITIFGIGIRPNKDIGKKSLSGVISINSSNVRISGLTGPSNGGVQIGFGVSNVTYTNIIVENSVFREIRETNSTSVLVDQLLIRNNVLRNLGWWAIELHITSNATVTNNVLYCTRSSGSISGDGVVFANNLFVGEGLTSSRAIATVTNCVFDHNIFYGAQLNITSASSGNVFDDNMSFGSTNDVFPVGMYSNTSNSPNQQSVDPVFVNMPIGGLWDNAYDFTLQTTSPALNVNGTDIGPSGGANPFNSEGNLLPLIQTVKLPAVITTGTDLPVTVKAKGN